MEEVNKPAQYDWLHFEVKSGKKFQADKFFGQAKKDAGKNQVPVVLWKKDRGEWMVYLRAKDLLDMVYDVNET